MRELLTELRDREFSMGECCKLFTDIDDYLTERERWAEYEGVSKDVQHQYLLLAEYRLQDTLAAMGIEYTLDEFITYD